MVILEAIQGVLDVFAGLGEVTIKGISLYLLVKSLDREEKPPK